MLFAIFHLHDRPTFKTKVLCLVSNKRGLKCILLLYKRILQPDRDLLWLQLAAHLTNFHPYDTPTFKTKARCLVSNEGWVKCLAAI